MNEFKPICSYCKKYIVWGEPMRIIPKTSNDPPSAPSEIYVHEYSSDCEK